MAFGQPFGTTFSTPAASGTSGGDAPDIAVQDCATDGVSALAWSPTQDNLLASSSWDSKVRIYNVQPQSLPSHGLVGASMISSFSHPPAPGGQPSALLDVQWSKDGTKLYSVGTDKRGFIFDAASQQTLQFAQHEEPIKSVRVVNIGNDPADYVATGSWDKTLRYWDPRTQKEMAKVQMNDRVYSMDFVAPWLVVACADRHIGTCDTTSGNPTNFNWTFSTLKWQTRVVSCFPLQPSDLAPQERYPGYAVGSIEGRVGIVYHDPAKAAQQSTGSFSFKCHRVELKGKTAMEKDSERRKMQADGTLGQLGVYAVNSIAFNRMNTFCTAGADGTLVTWEHYSKARLKQFDIKQGPISATAFSRDASMLAYSISYGARHSKIALPPFMVIYLRLEWGSHEQYAWPLKQCYDTQVQGA